MKITIVYDNTAYRNDLEADWGFAVIVDAHGKRILFDTGWKDDILCANMNKLGLSFKDMDALFISHDHFDHTGGIEAFNAQNNNADIWVPHSFREEVLDRAPTRVENPIPLYPGIYSTGELDNIEQSLCVETDQGIVIVTGCSHPAMDHIIEAASLFGDVYGIIGGLHGSSPKSLRPFQLICATHCTQYHQAIAASYPDAYIQGGAGRVIEIPTGEDTGTPS